LIAAKATFALNPVRVSGGVVSSSLLLIRGVGVDGPSAALAVMLHQTLRIVGNRPHLALVPKPLPERQCGRCERLRRLLFWRGTACRDVRPDDNETRVSQGSTRRHHRLWRRGEELALPKSVEIDNLSLKQGRHLVVDVGLGRSEVSKDTTPTDELDGSKNLAKFEHF
jgi:hypothetical protein